MLGGAPASAERSAAQETTSQETTGQGQGGTLRMINASMTSMDPIAAEDTASTAVTMQIFEGLVKWPNGSVPVQAAIAQDYEVSEDFTTYTFSLREGVSFHNGDEVTAQDFVYSFERLAASENSLMSADILDSVGVVHETTGEGEYVPGSLAVEATDDYTLTVEIEQPFEPAIQILGNNQFSAVPEGFVGDIEGYEGEVSQEEFATSNPVGAGPFTFESWEANTEARVSAFDDYYGTGPHVDGIHWQVIEDDNALYNYAMNENADLFTIPTAQYDPTRVSIEGTDDRGREFGTYGPLRNGKTANYLRVGTLNVFYIGFNMQVVEKPVRQAVAYALNQHLVVEQVFKGRGLPAYHYTIPAIFPGGPDAYTSHAREEYPYGYNESQLDQARSVLEEAGYGPNNRVELTFTLYEDQAWEQVAGILRDQLASAHVNMQIEQAPFSTLLERVREGNIDCYSLGWIVPWAAPDAFTKHLNPARSDPTGPNPEAYNFWPTDTQAAQRAIQAWETIQQNAEPTEQARQRRNEAYLVMEEANWTDVANLPVFHEVEDRMWYDHLEVPRFGSGGSYRQQYNEATLSRE